MAKTATRTRKHSPGKVDSSAKRTRRSKAVSKSRRADAATAKAEKIAGKLPPNPSPDDREKITKAAGNKGCKNVPGSTKCEDCTNCRDCASCTNCDSCVDCSGCENCSNCVDCVGCTDCSNQTGLKNATCIGRE